MHGQCKTNLRVTKLWNLHIDSTIIMRKSIFYCVCNHIKIAKSLSSKSHSTENYGITILRRYSSRNILHPDFLGFTNNDSMPKAIKLYWPVSIDMKWIKKVLCSSESRWTKVDKNIFHMVVQKTTLNFFFNFLWSQILN